MKKLLGLLLALTVIGSASARYYNGNGCGCPRRCPRECVKPLDCPKPCGTCEKMVRQTVPATVNAQAQCPIYSLSCPPDYSMVEETTEAK